jgi:hypothetical protein
MKRIVLLLLLAPLMAFAQVPDCLPGLYGAQFPGQIRSAVLADPMNRRVP